VLPRPSHPALNVRDDREAPLREERETAELLDVICPTTQGEVFGAGATPVPPIGTRGKSGDAPDSVSRKCHHSGMRRHVHSSRHWFGAKDSELAALSAFRMKQLLIT